METIEIAGTGLKPSRIGLGTWAIGGWMWGGSGEQDAIDTIHAALERGITLIDTAPVHGFGRSEEIVGKALADGGRRRRVVLATKCGIDWDAEKKPFRDSSRARIVREIEDSLRRLGTDVIDIYQVHWPDLETPFEETAQAMRNPVGAGQDPGDRRQQLLAGADGGIPRGGSATHRATDHTTCSSAASSTTYCRTVASTGSRP